MAAVRPWTGLHDIFYLILSHLSPDLKDGSPNCGFEDTSESKSARRALGRLARTHSSFTKLALASLWRSLPSQQPLEHLLCVVGIARRPRECNTQDLELCRTLATHGGGWIRFQKYASLVRTLVVDPVHACTPDGKAKLLQHTLWSQLLSACDTPILPRLEGVTIRSSNIPRSIDTGVLRLVSTSTVRNFGVAFPQSSVRELKQLGKTLAVFLSSMPNLEVLSIEVPSLAPFLNLELLSGLNPHLRYVKLYRSGSFKLGSLYHLASLPDLEYLSIKLHLRNTEPLSLPMPFPALRTLSVSCCELPVVGVLLDNISAPQLHNFTLAEMHKQSPDLSQTLPNYLRTLLTKCPSITRFEWRCRQLRVQRIGYFGQRHAGASLTSLVAPLLSHRALRHFSVSFWGPIVPYSPDDFRAMAEAWPDLETFSLRDERDEHYGCVERYADVESIAVFARHCPRLRSLHIPIVRVGVFARSVSYSFPPLHSESLREVSVDAVEVSILPADSDSDSETAAANRELDYEEGVRGFRALMQRGFPTAVVRISSEPSRTVSSTIPVV